MREATTASYVPVVNQNLGSLTTTAREGDTRDQKEAIERLGGLKDAAVKVVGQISGGRAPEDERTVQAFMMIPAARAVWLQGRRVLRVGRGHRHRPHPDHLRDPPDARAFREDEEELERLAHAAAHPVPVPRTAVRGGNWPGPAAP